MRVISVAFGVGSLALVILTQLAASQAVVSPEPVKHNLKTLAKEFQSIPSKDWKARRDFCIRLIDDRVIYRGCKVEDIVAIFGDNAKLVEATHDVESGGYIIFEQSDEPNGYNQARIGWSFYFKSPSNGEVWDYYLTNVSK
jgi:hypothetical protein